VQVRSVSGRTPVPYQTLLKSCVRESADIELHTVQSSLQKLAAAFAESSQEYFALSRRARKHHDEKITSLIANSKQADAEVVKHLSAIKSKLGTAKALHDDMEKHFTQLESRESELKEKTGRRNARKIRADKVSH
jgi:septal ring factor EnvC (AmiA/AmiB activator)